VKLAFRKYQYSWFVVFCLAAILAIVACNVWLLCCGRCVINDFLRIPPIGWVIITANLAAGIVLIVLRNRKTSHPDVNCCSSCHTALRDNWPFCPACGSAR
jgi:hypothetical protein